MVGLYFARILACSRVSEYETTITKKLAHEKDKWFWERNLCWWMDMRFVGSIQ